MTAQTAPKPPTLQVKNATLCFQGDFGMQYNVVHCRAVVVELAPYAQYKSAVRVKILMKGKRLWRSFTQGHDPNVVILEGHVDLKLPDMWTARHNTGAVETSQARHSGFSSGWDAEFAEALNASGAKVLADYRGHNSYRG